MYYIIDEKGKVITCSKLAHVRKFSTPNSKVYKTIEKSYNRFLVNPVENGVVKKNIVLNKQKEMEKV